MELLFHEFNRIDIAHIFISPDFALAISLSSLNNCILKKGLEFGIIMVTFKDFVESYLETEGVTAWERIAALRQRRHFKPLTSLAPFASPGAHTDPSADSPLEAEVSAASCQFSIFIILLRTSKPSSRGDFILLIGPAIEGRSSLGFKYSMEGLTKTNLPESGY
jgi:hypothetical protein